MMDANSGPSFFNPPEIISFPIEKFSHASSSPTSADHQWIHESKRDGLFLVFQNFQVHRLENSETSERHFTMSVSSGGNILEQQDLDRLVDMTTRFETMSQTMALNTSKIDAPVQIVVKCPCIAMRYTKDPTKIQRIQVRLKHDSDFEKSLDLLKNLGLPIKDATPAVIKGPFVNPSVPKTQMQTEVSNQGQATHFTTMKPKDSGLGNNRPLALSLQDDDRPRSTSSGTLRPNSAISSIPAYMDVISRPFSSLSTSSTPNSSGLTPNSHSVEELPMSSRSSMYVKQLSGCSRENGDPGKKEEISRVPLHILQTPSLGSLQVTSSPDLPAPNPSYASRNQSHGQPAPIYNSKMQSLARAEKADELTRPHSANTSHKSYFEQATVPGFHSNAMELGRSTSTLQPSFDVEPVTGFRIRELAMQSSQDLPLLRPRSVPTTSSNPNHHDWMPPRRDLPFLKDRQLSKLRPAAKSPLSTAEIAASVIKSPPRTSSAPQVPHKVVKRVAQRNTKKMPIIQDEVESGPQANSERAVPKSTVPVQETPVTEDMIATSPYAALPSKIVPSKRSSTKDTTFADPKRPRMVDRSSQTQNMTGLEDSGPLATLPNNTVVCDATTVQASSPPAKLLDQIDLFVTQHKARLPPVDPHLRPNYSEASEEEQQAIVNDWIIENLEDEGFGKLCEDVGNAWRRIGLGL